MGWENIPLIDGITAILHNQPGKHSISWYHSRSMQSTTGRGGGLLLPCISSFFSNYGQHGELARVVEPCLQALVGFPYAF